MILGKNPIITVKYQRSPIMPMIKSAVERKLVKSIWLKTQTKVLLLAQRMDKLKNYRLQISHENGEINNIETVVEEKGKWYKRAIKGNLKGHVETFISKKFNSPDFKYKINNSEQDNLSEELLLQLFSSHPYFNIKTPPPQF
jgi:hypothetical protein